ncbi:MAG TPA: hypothetical protein VEG34_10120, partial [Thermoanaerobaculia bacterium]|nr:hypothetical protein [Thermoanaerobaculia bacterium]
ELLQMRADLDGLARAHDDLSRERFALEERYFALNGELDAQRQDNGRLRSDLQRLYDEERKLRDGLDEHMSQLRGTYAEIERLNGMIRQMETTRAWRLHQWVQERKRS